MAGRGRKRNKPAKARKRNNTVRRIRGRGNYQVGPAGADTRTGVLARLDRVLRRIPRGAFANGGAALGAKYGGSLGAKVGRLAGAGMSAITGYGNYNVSGNSLSRVSTSMDMVPQFVKNEHSIRVRHREFIRDVIVPPNAQDFDLRAYVINPANRDLFPWLGQMARQYSQYKIHGMVFVFKTMSSDYAASGPLGTVMMATNYNAVDREFQSKIELENTEFAVSCKPSASLVHAIECDPKVSGFDVLYIRDPGYDTGETSDRRFYDYGKFQIATAGLPGNSGNTLGELWVSYDIELMKPIIGGVYTTATTVVSRETGTEGPSATSQYRSVLPRVKWTYPAIAPAVTTVYNPISSATAVVSGATAVNGPVVTVSNALMTFKKNGRYQIWVTGSGPTTSTTCELRALSETANISTTITKYGAAYYNADDADDSPYDPAVFGTNSIPNRVTNATSATGYSYTLAFQMEIGGVADAADYVTLSLGNFTTGGGSLLATWTRTVEVEWVGLGVNEQTERFTPLQDWAPPIP